MHIFKLCLQGNSQVNAFKNLLEERDCMKQQLNWHTDAQQLAQQLWNGKKVPGSFGTHFVKKIATYGGTRKEPKYLVAQAIGKMSFANYWRLTKHSKVLAIYPKPEDAANFATPHDPLSGTPRKYFNASIGAMHARHDHRFLGFGGSIEIDFMEGTPVGLVPKLTHTMASKYGGWREHLLDWLFSHAKKRRVSTVKFRVTHDEWGKERGKQSKQIFFRKAIEHGFQVEEPKLEHRTPGGDYFVTATKAKTTASRQKRNK